MKLTPAARRVMALLTDNGFELTAEPHDDGVRLRIDDPLDGKIWAVVLRAGAEGPTLDQLVRDFGTIDQRMEYFPGRLVEPAGPVRTPSLAG